MAGLYVHIPFCASRCIYCDFFSTTRLESMQAYTDSLCKELKDRSSTLSSSANTKIGTIYFGGGTPSQLPMSCLHQILESIYKYYSIAEKAEITIECNPEDISSSYLSNIHRTPINRLSFGIQTFDDRRLSFLNRRHDSSKAIRSIRESQDSGYDNISIDLIYGFPEESMSSWAEDVYKAIEQQIQHISAYCLSYEDGTVLTNMLQKGEISPAEDSLCSEMYYYLLSELKSKGYEHYEISNFALPGFYSRHNSSYWEGIPYIGIGAGAHSYDGKIRRWNVSSIDKYINGINSGREIFEKEELSDSDLYNEYIMTRLRTKKGLNIDKMQKKFSQSLMCNLEEGIKKHMSELEYLDAGKIIRVKEEKLFISDIIISDLFKV